MTDYIALARECGAELAWIAKAAWRDVRADGLPPCDGETVYVGENSAGYMGCFNAVYTDDCWMEGPEENTLVMSGLRFWRLQDRPGVALSAAPSQDREDALRYRWLRDPKIAHWQMHDKHGCMVQGAKLDNAIDDAMRPGNGAARQAPKEQTP